MVKSGYYFPWKLVYMEANNIQYTFYTLYSVYIRGLELYHYEENKFILGNY